MKKKIIASSKDKEDWIAFTKEMYNISVKEEDLLRKNQKANITPKLDLHGFSLDEANKAVKEFINKSFNKGYKKLLIVTGKGSRSKSYNNPYLSVVFATFRPTCSFSGHIVEKVFTIKTMSSDGIKKLCVLKFYF